MKWKNQAELAIIKAIEEVERTGRHTKLSEAVTLLLETMDKVRDFVGGVEVVVQQPIGEIGREVTLERLTEGVAKLSSSVTLLENVVAHLDSQYRKEIVTLRKQMNRLKQE